MTVRNHFGKWKKKGINDEIEICKYCLMNNIFSEFALIENLKFTRKCVIQFTKKTLNPKMDISSIC